MVVGLTILAAVVVIERYAPFSPLQIIFQAFPTTIMAPGHLPHRILFGYAMAMGFRCDVPARYSIASQNETFAMGGNLSHGGFLLLF
jgi:hypothetical protein